MWPKPSVPQTSPPGTALLQAEPRNSAPDFRFRTFEAQYILKRNSNRSAQTPACSGAPLDLGRAFDLLIVGGGINGAGIARDAGRPRPAPCCSSRPGLPISPLPPAQS